MNSIINTEKENMDCMTVDAEATEIKEIEGEKETKIYRIDDNNVMASEDTVIQTTVSSSGDQPEPPTNNISPKKQTIKKLDPTREISPNFENELKWIDLLTEKISGEKKDLEALPKKFNDRLKTIFQRFIFVNKHNKKDVCIFALRFGQLLNFIETKFEKKHKFTEWRAKVFSSFSERYVQKWQQAAKIGKVVEHFSEFGLDTAIELDYLVKRKKEEFPDVTDSEIIDTLQSFINLGGHSTERNWFRTSMDGGVTEFRFKIAIKEKNVSGMEKLIVEIRPLVLEMVKITGGALEKSDVQQIVSSFKNMKSDEERMEFMRNYTMDKGTLASEDKKNKEEVKPNKKGFHEAVVLFISRAKSQDINSLDISIDEVKMVHAIIEEIIKAKNIDITITTKEI